jgi:ABC-2 type transport system permease protein
VNSHRVAAIARRIVEQFRRDHRSLALVFVAPVMILALLGWVLRDQQPPATRLGVVNLAGAQAVPVVDRLRRAATSAGITMLDSLADEAAGDAALRGDLADIVVVLPASLPTDLAAGRPTTIEVVSQGVSPADDAARLGLLQRLVGGLVSAPPTASVTHRAIHGSSTADPLDAFAPALVGFFGFFFVFILTGISFLRERIGGTLERLLATPVSRGEIVAGYSLGFGLFATLQVVVILAFTLGSLAVPQTGPLPRIAVGLGVPSAGSPILAFAVVALLALSAVNLGIFLSTFARTELQILQFIPIVVVPQGLLGGVFWSIPSLPAPLQPVARLMPLGYAVDGLRDVMIRGADLGSAALRWDLAVLAAVAVVLVLLAARTIRREVV